VRALALACVVSACGARSRRTTGPIDAAPDAPLTLRDAQDVPDAPTCADADGDGHAAVACGGDDCDDADAATFPGAFRWNARRVEEGDYPAITLDDRDHADITFSGGNFAPLDDLMRASDFGDFIVDILDPDVAPRPAMVLEDRLPRIVYTVQASELRYFRVERVDEITVDWFTEPIETGVTLWPDVDIAQASDGLAWVVYSHAGPDEPADLSVASGVPGSWTIEPVALGTVYGPAIALDLDRAVVSYRIDEDRVEIARAGPGWVPEVLAETNWSTGPTDLAAHDGILRVVYENPRSGVPGSVLVVASDETGAWTESAVHADEWEYEPSIAIDADGVSHVAFSSVAVGRSDPTVRYASDATGDWVVETVATGARSPAIAVGTDGVPQIAYVVPDDEPAQGVWLAKREPSCP